MEKVITIGATPVRFKTNGIALLTYKREIGRDLIPDLFSIYGGKDEIEKANNAHEVNVEKLNIEAIYNISYVFAKIADSSIGSRDEWLESFDVFPVADIALEIVPLAIECITSDAKIKNRLATVGLRSKATPFGRKKSFWRLHKPV